MPRFTRGRGELALAVHLSLFQIWLCTSYALKKEPGRKTRRDRRSVPGAKNLKQVILCRISLPIAYPP